MCVCSSCQGTTRASTSKSSSAAVMKPGRKSIQAPSDSGLRSTAAPSSATPSSPSEPNSEGWTTRDTIRILARLRTNVRPACHGSVRHCQGVLDMNLSGVGADGGAACGGARYAQQSAVREAGGVRRRLESPSLAVPGLDEIGGCVIGGVLTDGDACLGGGARHAVERDLAGAQGDI